MLNSLTKWIRRLFSSSPQRPDHNPATLSEELSSAGKRAITYIKEDITIVPYDENLLERARTQWQFGDWESLAKLERSTLQHHPDRAKLALLAASGHLQKGSISVAKQLIQLAQDWGCSKHLISQILIAGVHNSLGRAAVIMQQEARALGHFHNAVVLGAPGSDVRLLTQARVAHQVSHLGQHNSELLQQSFDPLFLTTGRKLQKHSPIVSQLASNMFNVKQLTHLDLGEAWAGNTINTVVFRHHAILTLSDYQYTAFYVDERTLRLVERNLADNTLRIHDLEGQYNLCDAHNSISLGYDRQGHIHITYDHHGTQLRYRRSLTPYTIDSWTGELPMTGTHEERVTYPTFILPYHGHPLTLLYRDGTWNKGSARLKTYDETTQTWTDHPTPILSGAEEKPWSCNAYWNHPAIGRDGTLHLSFVWRTHSLGDEQRINNINIGYACSHDNGLTWLTSKNRAYQLPITPVNAETIYPISPGSNLINQSSMALDSQNRPHIVFYADDTQGIPQYQHLWFDGHVWNHQIISKRTTPFSLQGKGTLQIPISRPEIIIDHNDNVFILYRGDLTDNQLVAIVLKFPEYRYEASTLLSLWSEDLGYAEPILDRCRWTQSNILSLFIQNNHQPDGDGSFNPLSMPARIVDLSLHH